MSNKNTNIICIIDYPKIFSDNYTVIVFSNNLTPD